jgi:20S proteasome subunit beta 6
MEGVEHLPIPKDKAIGLVKDVFASASERDIYTGDSVDIQIITSKGVEHQTFALRR